MPQAAQKARQCRRTKAKYKAEQCHLQVIVRRIFLFLVVVKRWIKVPHDSNGMKGTADCINDKDGGNKERKDLVSEPCRVANDTIKIHKGTPIVSESL